MDEISEILHEEFHEAENRALKRLNKDSITQSQRAVGLGAYLSCCAIKTFQGHQEFVEEIKFEDRKTVTLLTSSKDYKTTHDYLHHNGCEHEHSSKGIIYYA